MAKGAISEQRGAAQLRLSAASGAMQAVVLLALFLAAGASSRGCDLVEGDTRKRACASTFVSETPAMHRPLAEDQKGTFCYHVETLKLCVQRGYWRAGCEGERAAFPSQLRQVVRKMAAVDCDAPVDAAPETSSTSDAWAPTAAEGPPAPPRAGRVRGSAAEVGGAWSVLASLPFLLLLL